ncbi:hypothetical protein JW872_03515 [Candidatus Babeliales bacterium]|nr:hypothetical protein [Candidatus Babeliales bacterium]
MEDSPFKRFIDLINYDQKTFQYSQNCQKLAEHAKKLEQRIADHSASRAAAARELKQLKQDVDTKELEMRALDTEEQAVRKKLGNVQDQRAYRAMKQEMQTLKEKQNSFEDILISSWKRLDLADRTYRDSQETYEQALEALQRELHTVRDEISSLKETIAAHEVDRQKYLKDLPEEWLEKYARMKTTVSDPVVPVSYDSCSACFTMLPAQDLLALRRRALLQCKGCFRLLYDPVLVGAE